MKVVRNHSSFRDQVRRWMKEKPTVAITLRMR